MTNTQDIYDAMTVEELASFKAASAQHHDESTPEFLTATKALIELQDRLGQDHPEVTTEAARVWALGPQSMRDFWADFQMKREERAADIARHQKESTPAYRAAVAEVMRLVELHGQDHHDTIDAMTAAMLIAPDCMKDWLGEKVDELGLLPAASGYRRRRPSGGYPASNAPAFWPGSLIPSPFNPVRPAMKNKIITITTAIEGLLNGEPVPNFTTDEFKDVIEASTAIAAGGTDPFSVAIFASIGRKTVLTLLDHHLGSMHAQREMAIMRDSSKPMC